MRKIFKAVRKFAIRFKKELVTIIFGCMVGVVEKILRSYAFVVNAPLPIWWAILIMFLFATEIVLLSLNTAKVPQV